MINWAYIQDIQRIDQWRANHDALVDRWLMCSAPACFLTHLTHARKSEWRTSLFSDMVKTVYDLTEYVSNTKGKKSYNGNFTVGGVGKIRIDTIALLFQF